jgi:hypothetical protein
MTYRYAPYARYNRFAAKPRSTATPDRPVTPGDVLALKAAVDAGLLGNSADFARDLIAADAKGKLTPGRAAWVLKLLDRASTPAPAPEAVGGDVAGIFALFANAKARGLKWPKIKLASGDGGPVVFKLAGPNSKYAGDVLVTDGGPFGANKWYGRITPAGEYVPGRAVTPDVRGLIAAFAADPAGVAAQYGKQAGACCFCGRGLDTPESLTVGYGPVCADKFGLPWGAVEQVVAPALVNVG